MGGRNKFEDIDDISINNTDITQSSIATDSIQSSLAVDTSDATSIPEDNPLDDQLLTNQKYFLTGKNTYEFTSALSDCIGCGTFSQVYRGINKITGEEVAVKKIKKTEYEYENEELRIMDSLKSDFLVALKDICSETSYSFIIMELCSASLEDHLEECDNQIIDAHDMRLIVDNIARGYKTLYDANIVHRDIKPQNILVKYDYNRCIIIAKISDFGISRILNDDYDEMLTGIAGTFQYMAPEIAANSLVLSKYEHQADIWSIGCLFYRCVTGMVPFDEAALSKLILFTACKNFEAYDKPELPESVEPEIRRLILSLLELNNNDRITPDQLYNRAINLNNSSTS